MTKHNYDVPVNWLECLFYFKGSVGLTLFGVLGCLEMPVCCRDAQEGSSYLLSERSPCLQLLQEPSIWEQCMSALRFQKHERHYQIDSLPRAGWVAVPGGQSLVFSDSELIKARGDRKAMLSLYFGEGDRQRADSCNPTVESHEECSRLLLRGSSMELS